MGFAKNYHEFNGMDRYYSPPWWTIEAIKRSGTAEGFMVPPRSWVVERMLAWLNRNRRLVKDFERTIASVTVWLLIASMQLYARHIARP